MRDWRLALLAAAAVLALQACDQSPPQTAVQPPQASLPDDTVLRGADGTQPAAPVAATPPAADAALPQTNAMGAAATTPLQAPAGQGTAAMTEMWQWQSSRADGDAAATSAQPPASAQPSAASPGNASQNVSSAGLPSVRDPGDAQGAQLLAQRPLEVPVAGIVPTALHDHFEQGRGNRRHEAIDILAPAGTPVVAVDDGRIAKLFTSKPGGLTIYQFDPQSRLAYYYAHLQRYADGVHEGMDVHRGELLGYVGSTGNADTRAPHLHFAVFRLGDPPKWWQGEAVNPYPALSRAKVASR